MSSALQWIPALLATVFFALSTVSGRRNVRALGSAAANFWRQAFAVLLLGIYAHIWGQGFHGASLGWFLLSGFIGFGMGDVAIYLALPRLGARVTALMTQCLAVPLGVVLAWAWHGTRPSGSDALGGGLILFGVVVALSPSGPVARPEGLVTTGGILCGIIAAVGQAGGQVVAKHGFQLAQARHTPADPGTVTYQRIFPGVAVALLWFLWDRWRQTQISPGTAAPDYRRAAPWIALNTLAGPTLGVACYQWATKLTDTALVLSLTAMTPLVVIPLAYLIDGDKPTWRGVVGGFIAVGGVWVLTAGHRAA